MKKLLAFSVAIAMIITALPGIGMNVFAYSNPNGCAVVHGDINRDGTADLDDYDAFMSYLSGEDVTVDEKALDVTGDDEINAKDLTRLSRYISGENVKAFYNHTQYNGIIHKSFVYGKSELGKPLVCHSIYKTGYTRSIVLNFAIHGFEDDYDADGQILVNTANALVDYYETYSGLGNCRLLIVPCANPDGLYDGYTKDGFGRCNSKGIDLNRDFDANYASQSNARNYTPYAFSAAESRALRDLCSENSPEIVVDFHGWLNYTIGDSEIAEVAYEELGLSHYVSFTSSNARGYFANWAHQHGAYGLLLEYTSPSNVSVEKTKNFINRLIAGNYDGHGEAYTLSETYGEFTEIQCYTLSKDRVTTYASFNTPFSTPSYIDGTTDLCTINKIYENGWVKVTYPISGGTKPAYCYLSDFIDPNQAIEIYPSRVAETTTVYSRADMSEKLGSVWNTDQFYVVAQNDSAVQIIFPLDSGGWKMGWIQM